jgi:hypothetical protein
MDEYMIQNNGRGGSYRVAATSRQVGLRTDALDKTRVGRVDRVHEANKTTTLVGVVLKVIIVDVTDGGWVDGLGLGHGDTDKVTVAEGVREHGGTESTAVLVVEDLVDDVPSVDLALEAAGDVGNVVLDDGGLSSACQYSLC